MNGRSSPVPEKHLRAGKDLRIPCIRALRGARQDNYRFWEKDHESRRESAPAGAAEGTAITMHTFRKWFSFFSWETIMNVFVLTQMMKTPAC